MLLLALVLRPDDDGNRRLAEGACSSSVETGDPEAVRHPPGEITG